MLIRKIWAVAFISVFLAGCGLFPSTLQGKIISKYTMGPHSEKRSGVAPGFHSKGMTVSSYSYQVSVPAERHFSLKTSQGVINVRVSEEDFLSYEVGDPYECKKVSGCDFTAWVERTGK